MSTAVAINSQKLSERLHIVCDGKNDLSAISLLHLQRAWAQPLREACRVVAGTNSSNGPRLRACLSIFSPSNRHSNLIKTRLWWFRSPCLETWHYRRHGSRIALHFGCYRQSYQTLTKLRNLDLDLPSWGSKHLIWRDLKKQRFMVRIPSLSF